jgi:hypothetical protein
MMDSGSGSREGGAVNRLFIRPGHVFLGDHRTPGFASFLHVFRGGNFKKKNLLLQGGMDLVYSALRFSGSLLAREMI